MTRPKIPASWITLEYTACPYCGNAGGSKISCCGESSQHFVDFIDYIDADGDARSCPTEEIEVIEDQPGPEAA